MESISLSSLCCGWSNSVVCIPVDFCSFHCILWNYAASFLMLFHEGNSALRETKDDCLCSKPALILTCKNKQSTEWHFWGVHILRNSGFCKIRAQRSRSLLDRWIYFSLLVLANNSLFIPLEKKSLTATRKWEQIPYRSWNVPSRSNNVTFILR